LANQSNLIPSQDHLQPDSWLLRVETQASIQQGLARLNPQDRQLLLLKYTEDWGYEQLAQHLGVSVKTIEYRLLKARRALRSELSKTHLTPEPMNQQGES
jgi:RNA polymerase sigma-70 factor (ECF subfamily)